MENNIQKELENIKKEFAEIKMNTLIAVKEVLTFNDVVALTGLAKSTLYKLTCNHQIPYYKPCGKYLYFEKAEVMEWMRRGRVDSVNESEEKAAAHNTKRGGRV